MVMQSSANKNPDERQQTILNLSRGTAIILLIMYAFYLNFSLRTHHNLFVPKSKQQPQRSPGDEERADDEAPVAAEAEEDGPLLGAWASGAVLVITTVLVAICADYLVDSIDSLVERANISRNFIGLILIPIVGNAAEHVTAVIVAVKNNMDLVCAVQELARYGEDVTNAASGYASRDRLQYSDRHVCHALPGCFGMDHGP